MLREYVRLAIGTLGANRLRSVLTVSSIAIGVGAVILLTSLAESGLATLNHGLEEVGGSRLIMLWSDNPKKAAAKAGNDTVGLTRADAQALQREVPLIQRITSFQTQRKLAMRRFGTPDHAADMMQADEQFMDVFAYTTSSGRGLTAQDLAERARVAVVGDDLATKMFPHEDPVGQELIIANQRYRVIGRLAHAGKSGVGFGWDWDDCAIVPLTVAFPAGKVNLVVMQSRDKDRNVALLDVANAILLARHNQVDDFQFLDFGNMLKGYRMVFVGMIVVVGLIAGMSLVIGGVGIMNIMLVAVLERRREIGVRRAVGATKGAVLGQFMVEALVLGLFGAVIGTIGGVGLAKLAAVVGPHMYPGWVGIIDMPAVAVAIGAAGSVGLFFGWYPARQAAELDPILCLRSE